jgi:hypothetical protein
MLGTSDAIHTSTPSFLPPKLKPQLPLMWSMVYDLNVVSVHGVSFTVLN